ncbi:MAG: sugar ABC transporter substrate-binding protein [Arthrobacter sp.]|jgi:multiple sugar transport system substrate-binding protein|nr:sugar ABC transporter substrate-binding protein [Arthrobacter sp.]
MKRQLAAAASIAVLGLSLTACSGGSSSGDGGGDTGTITYAIWDENQKPAMEQIAQTFEAENPGAKVEIQLTPNSQYWTKLQTAMSGGNGPDVMWMNGPQFGLYASEGQLAPLEDTGLDKANYPSSLTDLYTFDGKLYGAPKDFDTVALWYNKDLLKKAGVDVPTTWAEMQSAAKKLTTGDVKGFAAANYTQENVYDVIAQAGGEVISADHKTSGYGSPQALEGVNYLLSFIKDGSSPTAQQMVDTLPEDQFMAGKVAMIYMASYEALPFSQSSVAKSIDVAPLPEGPAGNQSVIHGLANVANAKSKHLTLAKKFAAYASGEEASKLQADTGTVIPAYNGTQDAWVKSMPQYDLQVHLDAVDGSVPYPISLRRSEWSQLEKDALPQIWAKPETAEAGLKQLGADMQAKLDAENE